MFINGNETVARVDVKAPLVTERLAPSATLTKVHGHFCCKRRIPSLWDLMHLHLSGAGFANTFHKGVSHVKLELYLWHWAHFSDYLLKKELCFAQKICHAVGDYNKICE